MTMCCLIGNIVQDIPLKKTSNGISVCRFTLAVNIPRTDENEERKVNYYSITAWRGLAENVAKYLKKGDKAFVMGSFTQNIYPDRDGVIHHSIDVVAEKVEFLGKPNRSVQTKSNQMETENFIQSGQLLPYDGDNDIPF